MCLLDVPIDIFVILLDKSYMLYGGLVRGIPELCLFRLKCMCSVLQSLFSVFLRDVYIGDGIAFRGSFFRT